MVTNSKTSRDKPGPLSNCDRNYRPGHQAILASFGDNPVTFLDEDTVP